MQIFFDCFLKRKCKFFLSFFSVPSLPSQEEDSSICSNCGGCNSVVEVVSSPIAIEVDGGSGGDEDDPPDQTVPINAKMRESPTMISRCNHKQTHCPCFYCAAAQLTTDQCSFLVNQFATSKKRKLKHIDHIGARLLCRPFTSLFRIFFQTVFRRKKLTKT